eukprot:jgi/Ulvmu1/472/UM001_0480.1
MGTDTIDTDNSRKLGHGLSKRFATKAYEKVGDKIYTWQARHYRRNRPQEQEVAGKPELERFSLFDADRIKNATSNPAKTLSFLAGPLFFVGSLLFIVGAASQLDVRYWQGKWPQWRELAFVDVPFLVGALLFLAGACTSFLEAANAGFSKAWQLWHSRGRSGPRPRLLLALWPTTLRHELVSFYGAALQYAGAIVFVVGTATEVANTADPDLSETLVRWLLDFQYALGGALFTAGGFLFAAEGSHSWWRGLLPPLRREDARSVNHWAEFFNWLGSLLFALGGGAEWLTDAWSPGAYVAITAGTWLAGSLVFLAQGALLYLETVNPAW